MARKATVKDLNAELKILFEKVIKLEEKEGEKDRKLKEMEIAIKANEETIFKLEKMLTGREDKKSSMDIRFNCKECGKSFLRKKDLRDHIQRSHERKYDCKVCEKSFSESWKLELHSKTHEENVPFKCNICEKQFHFKWRLNKHVVSHDKNAKFCHFFNNGKKCPFEEIGCKFKHILANKCKYDGNCYIKLCQFQHSASKDSEEIIDKVIKSSDKYSKYNELNENEQFDVYQEICMNICWGGDHKCMAHDADNKLLGVDVEKIRDDYNNGRKEKFHCEKCEYLSTEIEDVRRHFMTKHKKSFPCWECGETLSTITEFKEHYGSFHFTGEEFFVESS